jgi:hypothetical protein
MYTTIQLLYGILVSLPFTVARLMDSALGILHPTKSLNPLIGSLGLKLGLSFIPELIATLILVVVGIWTRNVISLTSGNAWKKNGRRVAGGSSIEEVSKV